MASVCWCLRPLEHPAQYSLLHGLLYDSIIILIRSRARFIKFRTRVGGVGLQPAGEQSCITGCITGCIATGGGETQCFFLSLGLQGFPDQVHTHTLLASLAQSQKFPLFFCSLLPSPWATTPCGGQQKERWCSGGWFLMLLVVAEAATLRLP